jgi:2-oxoglutarate ferredoxin oxidoreductase subunit gamma
MLNGTEKIIMAGFGGQGILFMGRLLAYVGMLQDKEVTFIPSYGAEMRGGTANCRVVLSEKPIGSPLVETPDTLIVMNRPSLDKFETKLKSNGLLVINTSLVDRDTTRKDIRALKVPATRMAEELGRPGIANLIALGAYLKFTGLFEMEPVVAALAEWLPPDKAHLMEINRKALAKGFEYKQ